MMSVTVNHNSCQFCGQNTMEHPFEQMETGAVAIFNYRFLKAGIDFQLADFPIFFGFAPGLAYSYRSTNCVA
jgi:hypothetical protein